MEYTLGAVLLLQKRCFMDAAVLTLIEDDDAGLVVGVDTTNSIYV